MEMTDTASKNLTELPDLPGLERVETRGSNEWLFALFYSAFMLWQVVFIAILFWRYRHFLGREGYILTGLVFSLVGWLVLRMLTGYTYFATDHQGLTMRSRVSKRTIPWLDVQEAASRQRSKRTTLRLVTTRGRFTATPSALGSMEGECIVASAWQHLRRFGKSDGIKLSADMLRMWEPIPDDVPAEVDWGKPPRAFERVGPFVGLLIFPAFAAFFLIADARSGIMYVPLVLISFIFFLKMLILPGMRSIPRQVSVRPDGLILKLLFRDAYVPWSSVAAAWWQGSSQGNYLCVRSAVPRAEVWLPYTLGKRESEQLILSVTRYLRNAGTPQAVPLPDLISRDTSSLKQAAYSGQKLGYLQRAFLNTLDPAIAKRIQRIYSLQFGVALLAMFAFAAIPVANVPGIISERLFSCPGTRCFVASSSWALVLLMIGALAVAGVAMEKVGYRLAGPYRDVWREFCKVGSGNSRVTRILLWIFIAVFVLGIASVPCFVCCYTRVTDKGIAMNRPLRFHEQFYPWGQIQQMEVRHTTRLDHGETHEDRRYIVKFEDHTDWTISDDGTIWEKARVTRAMNFVQRVSRRPIRDRWMN